VHFGLAVSVALHVGVLVWALIGIQSTRPFKMPEPEPVEVALVSADALVRLKQGDRTAKQLEAQPQEGAAKETPKKEAPKPKPQAAAPPTAAEPQPAEPAKPEPPKPDPPKAPEPVKTEPQKDPIAEKLAALPPPAPEPGPTPDEKKLLEEKLEQERKAEEARKQAEAKKKADEEKKRKVAEAKKKAEAEKKRKEAEAKKKQFDAQRIAALLNKVPDKSPPPAGTPTPPVTPTKAKGPVAGAPEGRDSQLTASQRSALLATLLSSVKRCWYINAGNDGANSLAPIVEFELNRDGSVRGLPRVANPSDSPQFQDAASSAIRAVVQCAPYNLPPEHYSDWEFARLRFDPGRMF
jgi:colicin import membrane protein